MPSKSEVIPEWVKSCAQDKNILDLEPFTSNDDPTKIFRIRSLAKNGNGNKDECFRFQSIYDEVKESTVTGNHPLNPLTRKPLLESEVTAFHKMRAEKFPELPRLDYPPSDKAVNMRHVQDAFENMFVFELLLPKTLCNLLCLLQSFLRFDGEFIYIHNLYYL
jgi:hypothetical protein